MRLCFMPVVIYSSKWRWKRWKVCTWESVRVHNVTFVATNETDLQCDFEVMIEELNKINIKINSGKTKLMLICSSHKGTWGENKWADNFAT